MRRYLNKHKFHFVQKCSCLHIFAELVQDAVHIERLGNLKKYYYNWWKIIPVLDKLGITLTPKYKLYYHMAMKNRDHIVDWFHGENKAEILWNTPDIIDLHQSTDIKYCHWLLGLIQIHLSDRIYPNIVSSAVKVDNIELLEKMWDTRHVQEFVNDALTKYYAPKITEYYCIKQPQLSRYSINFHPLNLKIMMEKGREITPRTIYYLHHYCLDNPECIRILLKLGIRPNKYSLHIYLRDQNPTVDVIEEMVAIKSRVFRYELLFSSLIKQKIDIIRCIFNLRHLLTLSWKTGHDPWKFIEGLLLVEAVTIN